MRLLYVALTRARDRVVICGRTSAKGVADSTSWWTRLSAAFDALETREVVEDGRTLLRFGDDPQIAAHAAKAEDAALAPASPAWARVEAEALRAARAGPRRRTLPTRPRAPAPHRWPNGSALGRFRRGDLIHKLFEVLAGRARPNIGRAAAERLLARRPGLSADQRAEMVGRGLRRPGGRTRFAEAAFG